MDSSEEIIFLILNTIKESPNCKPENINANVKYIEDLLSRGFISGSKYSMWDGTVLKNLNLELAGQEKLDEIILKRKERSLKRRVVKLLLKGTVRIFIWFLTTISALAVAIFIAHYTNNLERINHKPDKTQQVSM